jgi:hypothetical protein
MNRAWVFLHEVSKFKGGFVPSLRVLTSAIEVAQEIAEQEVEAGRISSPDYYSKEIQRYEDSALRSTRII